MTHIPAVELIYRELARPKSPEAKPERVNEEPKRAALTRDDVAAILSRRRDANEDELQQIISNANEYKLTPCERNQLSVDLTIQMAHARQNNGRREDPSARFIDKVLGLVETEFGLL